MRVITIHNSGPVPAALLRGVIGSLPPSSQLPCPFPHDGPDPNAPLVLSHLLASSRPSVPLAAMHLTREERIPFVPRPPCLPCLSTVDLFGARRAAWLLPLLQKMEEARATRAAPCTPSPSITPKAPASPKQPLAQILQMCCWTLLPWGQPIDRNKPLLKCS